MQPRLNAFLDFLTQLFHNGLGYSGLCTARAAVGAFLDTSGANVVTSHKLVSRLLKGCFIANPTLPKTLVTWDVNQVFTYLQQVGPIKSLTLLNLGQNLSTLLAILSGQRGQTIYLMDIRNISISKSQIKIRIGDLLKQSKPGRHLSEINIAAHDQDTNICPVAMLSEYLDRTTTLRKSTRLLVSSLAPHGPISRDTLARWIKSTLVRAGINMGVFTPHSTRAASTSAAAKCRVPLDTILKTAGWQSENIFKNFYNKNIDTAADLQFSESLLHNHEKVNENNGMFSEDEQRLV